MIRVGFQKTRMSHIYVGPIWSYRESKDCSCLSFKWEQSWMRNRTNRCSCYILTINVSTLWSMPWDLHGFKDDEQIHIELDISRQLSNQPVAWALLAAFGQIYSKIEKKRAECKDLSIYINKIWSEKEHIKICEQGGEGMVVKDIFTITKKWTWTLYHNLVILATPDPRAGVLCVKTCLRYRVNLQPVWVNPTFKKGLLEIQFSSKLQKRDPWFNYEYWILKMKEEPCLEVRSYTHTTGSRCESINSFTRHFLKKIIWLEHHDHTGHLHSCFSMIFFTIVSCPGCKCQLHCALQRTQRSTVRLAL